MQDIQKIVDETKKVNDEARAIQKKYYDRNRRQSDLVEGDLVLRITHTVSVAEKHFVGKFAPKFEGPYNVSRLQDNVATITKDGQSSTANVDQLKKYYRREDMAVLTGDQRSEEVQQSNEQNNDLEEDTVDEISTENPDQIAQSRNAKRKAESIPVRQKTIKKFIKSPKDAMKRKKQQLQSESVKRKNEQITHDSQEAGTSGATNKFFNRSERQHSQYNLRKRRHAEQNGPPAQRLRAAFLHQSAGNKGSRRQQINPKNQGARADDKKPPQHHRIIDPDIATDKDKDWTTWLRQVKDVMQAHN